tara:strand:- start:2557 stop:4023 length:1467 start_codon:yes stop_codon:yes gene_type:complete
MNILIIHNSVISKTRDISKLSSLSDNVKIIEAIFPDDLTQDQIDYYITKKNFGCMPAGYKNPEKIKRKICCALSHFKALEFIIENKLNDVIIFEDDAVMYNQNLFEKFLSNRDLFEKNYITYLGGFYFINSNKQKTKYIMDAHAYYIHNYEQATKLYDKLKNASKLRAYDNLIKREIQEKNLPYDWFPIFIQNDEYFSHIDDGKRKKSWTKLEKSLTASRELNQDYTIAIPSYKREKTLRDRTMKLLQDYNIDPKKINIFVANDEQKKLYENTLQIDSYNKIIVGEVGIKNIRNFMANYFDEGQHIFYIDDDIYDIYECINNDDINNKKNNKLIKLKSLDDLILKGFELCKEKNLNNWGVYPVHNAYFMKPTSNDKKYISTNLCYIIGFMTGVINNKIAELRTIDDKEDYERTIKYYLKDRGVLRFNNITCKTKCYKEAGGMQIERTKQRIHDSALYLTEKYPELCSLNTSKKSGFSEIRLKYLHKFN